MAARIEGHPLMTGAEVATAFQVDLQTVGRWRRSGRLATTGSPGGKSHRFFRAEVEALLNGEPLTARQLQELRDQLAREATS